MMSSKGRSEGREDVEVNEVERDRRIVYLLGKAVELDRSERGRFLDGACAGDPALRAELAAMLEEGPTATDDFLGAPAVAQLALDETLPFDDADRPPPQQQRWIGPYRIVGILGRGGMGTVYRGEQEEPVRRQVALKVIEGIHDPTRLQRFAAECQALARLHHPNVASLYEVGTTGQERPYVAMELVDGTAITSWCDQHRLSLGERIELFLGVCAGVRHAHEKGILHRDLKPANVLVTEIDGVPTAKVIDFGIARAIGDPLHSGSRPMTLDHQIVGSPAYMCPEAAAGEREIDTRSDVYALGLLLYELLVGVPPLEHQGVGLGIFLRRILTEEPPVASVRYGELDAERQQQLAAERSLADPRQLSRRIRGDLDAILATTLARAPADRYSSPADLAADLKRHLELQPVGVRSPSARYLTGRFIRRHFTLVAAAALVMIALVAGIVGTARQAVRANRQAERANHEAARARQALAEAQQLSGFLVELFGVADPERGPGEPVDVRELLDRGAQRLHDELGDQPLARALFMHTIGEIYTKMALFEPAEELIGGALEIRERELDKDHPDVLESVNQLGVVYRRQKRLDEAEPLLRRVLAAREAQGDPVAVGLALNNLGNLLWNQRRFDEAEAAYRHALAIREAELGPDHRDAAETLNNLGALFQAQKAYDQAMPYLLRAAEIYLEELGTDHPRYAATLFNLSLIEPELGQWRDAEDHCRRAAAIWQASYGPKHPRTFAAQSRVAYLLRRQGHYEESAQHYRTLLDERADEGLENSQVRRLFRNLARAQARLGDYDSAENNYRHLLEFYLEDRSEDDPSVLRARSKLAWLAGLRGDHALAEVAHRQVLDERRRVLGEEHRDTAWSLHHLALALADMGRDPEAEALWLQALEIRRSTLGEDHLDFSDTLHQLGRLAGTSGRTDEARRLLGQALEIRRRKLPADHPDRRETLDALSAIGDKLTTTNKLTATDKLTAIDKLTATRGGGDRDGATLRKSEK